MSQITYSCLHTYHHLIQSTTRTIHLRQYKVSNSEEFCFIGDLNARFGTRMRNMPRVFGTMKIIRTRTFLVECLRAQNENASILASECEESKLLVLNNFKTPVE